MQNSTSRVRYTARIEPMVAKKTAFYVLAAAISLGILVVALTRH